MRVATVEKKNKKSWCARSGALPKETFELIKYGLKFTIKNQIDEIAEVWDALTPDESFAQSQYLKTLELTNPSHLSNLYVVVTKGNKKVAAVLLQSLVLRLSDSFDYDNYTTNRSFFSRLWQKVRQVMVSLITFRLITIGNLYLTGQYGMYFDGEEYSKEEQFKIAHGIIKILKKKLSKTDYRFRGVLYKDFFEDRVPDNFEKLGLYPFNIDPNMILSLRPSWQTFDDYLLDMKSKYRVRLKNALKKFQGIDRRVLTYAEIQKYNDRMYELYSSILDGSGFVLAMGRKNYFSELKNQLRDDLQVVGYFRDGELVGFYTWILEGEKMDSHFIGFDKSLNNQYQIYLNILLDLVKDAICQKAKRLYYYRTALEIKSSVGSEPYEMTCFFRHTNPFFNKGVPFAFKYFVPHQNWKQRHPFKRAPQD